MASYQIGNGDSSGKAQGLSRDMRQVLKQDQGKKDISLLALAGFGVICLFYWLHATGSLAILSLLLLTLFFILYILTNLLTIWIKNQPQSSAYSFGYERCEVLAVFSNTMIIQLGCFFLCKEGSERLFEPEEINGSSLIPAGIVAMVIQLIILYGSRSRAYEHVISASSSNWLQEHVSDICRSICHIVPGLSYFLLPRINPFSLCSVSCCACVLCDYFLVEAYGYQAADTAMAFIMSTMIVGTMFPMSLYTAKILMQTTPPHVIPQMDKCLHEVATLDGVLEIRQQYFWTVSFGQLAGLVHVRVRRDADEQLVLAHITRRLLPVVQNLTIQLFKDDWFQPVSSYFSSTPAEAHPTAPPPVMAPMAAGRASPQPSKMDVTTGSPIASNFSWQNSYSPPQLNVASYNPSGAVANGHGHSHDHDDHGHGHSHDNDDHGHGHSHDNGHGHSHGGSSNHHGHSH